MKQIEKVIKQNYRIYLDILKDLVSINSVYSNTKGINKALQYCRQHFEKNLKNFNIYFDKESNLICQSELLNKNMDIVYFSAHIDTVPAEEKEWDKRFSPFIPYEDSESIVGRGVSDDKSGVAFQLFVAYLIKHYYYNSTNLVFTISKREEQGGQSACEIGAQLGNTLPLESKAYLLTLENNVQATHPPTLCINYGELGAVGIEVTGTLEEIKRFLHADKNLWNPTVVYPHLRNQKNVSWEYIKQQGGHAATVLRESNKLFTILQGNVKNLLILAGNKDAISTVPTIINSSFTPRGEKHTVILDLRTMKHVQELKNDLHRYKINYRFIKTLDYGYDLKEKLIKEKIYTYMTDLVNEDLKIKFEINPGSTDSATIYKSINNSFKDKVLPLTFGPGTRSQRDAEPSRLTHGINETYDKQAGLLVIQYITKLLYEMKFLRQN